MSISGISGAGSGALFLGVSATNSLATNPQTNTTNPFSNLDLTQSQQQQISQILQNGKSQGLTPQQVVAQITALLSPSQQQTLAADLQQLQQQGGGHHHHHHHHGGSSSASNSSNTDAWGIPTPTSSNSSQSGPTISNIAASASFWSQQQQDSD